MERAQASRQYQPHFLLRDATPLPSVLRPMRDFLLSRRCQLLEWACLRYAQLHPCHGALELACLAMQLVSLAVSWLKSDDISPGRVGTGRCRLAQMLTGSGPQWCYGPGGIEGLRALAACDASAETKACAEHLLVVAQGVVDDVASDAGQGRGSPITSSDSERTLATESCSLKDTRISGNDGRPQGNSAHRGAATQSCLSPNIMFSPPSLSPSLPSPFLSAILCFTACLHHSLIV